jgi:hypothetical protein
MYTDACGPTWLPTVIRRPLFGWFFEASCRKHDEGYGVGGDAARRKVCDKKFLQAMLKDSKRSTLTRVPKAVVAYAFYAAVRVGGSLSFNYTDGK